MPSFGGKLYAGICRKAAVNGDYDAVNESGEPVICQPQQGTVQIQGNEFDHCVFSSHRAHGGVRFVFVRLLL